MVAESGDQAGLPSNVALVVRSVTARGLSGGTRSVVTRMLRSALPAAGWCSQASRVPSGDQAGRSSLRLSPASVSSIGPVPAAMSWTKISKLPAVPFAYAIFVRSGDQVGWRYCPPSGVTGPVSVPPPTVLLGTGSK